MQIQIGVVRSLAELSAIEPQWKQLWQRAVDAVFYQQHEWCLAAWKHLFHATPDHSLHIVTAHSGESLVAILPLVRRHRWLRPAKFAWLTFADHPVDVLLDAELARSAELEAVLRHMLAACDGILAISPVRETAHLSLLSRSQETVSRPALVAFLCELDTGEQVEDVISGLSKSALIYERRDWRRLIGEGPCLICWARDLSEIDAILAGLVQLKRDWLAHRNKQSGWLSNDAAIAALREYLETAIPAGKATLTYLILNGQTLAIQLLFSNRSNHTPFFSAYSGTFKRVSAGRLLMMASMRRVHRTPGQTFDLLGGETKLKRQLCNRQVAQHSISMDCRRFRKQESC